MDVLSYARRRSRKLPLRQQELHCRLPVPLRCGDKRYSPLSTMPPSASITMRSTCPFSAIDRRASTPQIGAPQPLIPNSWICSQTTLAWLPYAATPDGRPVTPGETSRLNNGFAFARRSSWTAFKRLTLAATKSGVVPSGERLLTSELASISAAVTSKCS